MNAIEIRPGVPADADAIGRIHHDALDPYQALYIAFFSNHPRDILPKSSLIALQKPDQKVLVAFDVVTKEVVGFIRYEIADKDNGESKESQANEQTDERCLQPLQQLFAPKMHLKDLWDRFSKRDDEMDACYEKEIEGKRHICTCPTASCGVGQS
jgi:hypothetical protein